MSVLRPGLPWTCDVIGAGGESAHQGGRACQTGIKKPSLSAWWGETAAETQPEGSVIPGGGGCRSEKQGAEHTLGGGVGGLGWSWARQPLPGAEDVSGTKI